MSFTIYVTEDYEHMSDVASTIVIDAMSITQFGHEFHFGACTGSSPLGVYDRIEDNQDRIDPSKMIVDFMDEYIGLPGDTPEERRNHPESYDLYSRVNFADRLQVPLKGLYVPQGYMIDADRLEHTLQTPDAAVYMGNLDGRHGVAVLPNGDRNYVSDIYEEFVLPHVSRIVQNPVDLFMGGVGGVGHVAFHEANIPLHLRMMLVGLDQITRQHALQDWSFSSMEDVPRYALSLGAPTVAYLSKNVLILASDERKADPIAYSVLDPVTSRVPLSIMQDAAQKGTNVMYVIDREAAQGLEGNIDRLHEKGIEVVKKY